jgi:hypothetical protein
VVENLFDWLMALKYQERLRRKRLLRIFAVTVGLVVVISMRVTSSDDFLSPREPTASVDEYKTISETPPKVDPYWEAVRFLDGCRSQVLAKRSIVDLENCVSMESPAYMQDQKLIDELIAKDLVFEEIEFEILDVQFLARRITSEDEFVSLQVSDKLRPLQLLIGARGIQKQPGREIKDWLVVLVKDVADTGLTAWRFWEVSELESSFNK